MSNKGAIRSYTFDNVTANHTIAVTFRANTYAITSSAGANGSIGPLGHIPVTGGTDKTFLVTPAKGYQVADVLVDGRSVGAVTSYTFTSIAANHTISATFAVKP